jgi:hypothetical protein
MWFRPETAVSKDPGKIEDFLTRGVSGLYPEKEKIRAMLMSGKKLSMYLGIDPTGPTLHLGHAIAIRKLKAFQDLGHTAILLIGSFTAQIGDPTDKLAARVRLTEKEVLANATLYKQQASTLLNFSGSNPAKVLYNGDWLSKMTFSDVIEIASKVTVQEMLKRDMFETRMREEKPIYLHEFFYPLMQGYDSVAMNVDGEIGGNDQLFNMLVGRDLVRAIKQKEKFVLTMKLLTDSTGEHLRALNHVARRIAESRLGDADGAVSFVIDVGGHLEGELERIRGNARMLAQRARLFKHEVELDPMSSYERLVIHELFSEDPEIKTESRGEGKFRHIVLKYIEKGAGV